MDVNKDGKLIKIVNDMYDNNFCGFDDECDEYDERFDDDYDFYEDD